MSYSNNYSGDNIVQSSNYHYPNPRPVVVITNAYGVQQNYEQSPQYQDYEQHQQQQHQQQRQQQLPMQFYNDDDSNNYSCAEYQRKNRAQSNATTSACLIASAAGIHLSYIYSYLQLYHVYTDYKELSHILVSWFVGLVIGAIISAFLVRSVKKSYFNYVGSILTIASGIIFIAISRSYVAIVLARYTAGLAYGLILIPVIIHSGEISVKKLRGSLIANIQICFTIGLLLGSIFYAIYFNSFENLNGILNIHQLCGIGIILFGVQSFIFNIFTTIESPLFLIDQKQDNDAFRLYLKLKNENYETIQLRNEFNDIKLMYLEDTTLTFSPIVKKNLRPLLLLCLLRCVYALLTSLPINYKLFLSVHETISTNLIELIILPKLLSEIICWIIIDRKGRRHLLNASLLLSGICLILGGILYNNNIRLPISITILSFFYQFFIGLGISIISLVYMSELFTYAKKASSLLIIIAFENLIHILLIYILIFDYINFNYVKLFYITGIFAILYSFICFKYLPETKNSTLRQCRNMIH